jgi:hypothetical protein
MQTPQVPIAGPAPLRMGLSWFVVDAGGRRLLYHGGDTFGQHTECWSDPEAGFAFVAMLNAQPGGAIAGPQAFAAAAREYLGPRPAPGGATPTPAPESSPAPTPPAPPAATPEQLAPYAGRYRTPNVTITVRPQEGGLLLSIEPTLVPGQVGPDLSALMMPEMLEQRAQLVGPDLAVVSAEGLTLPVPFVRRADGSVGWMSLNTRLVPRVGPA